jgi:hypothetical protein
MARTMTVRKGTTGGTDYSPGWKELKISDAGYGEWEGTQYLDIWFDGYPENMSARIYAQMGKDGEEFAIAQVFRFANAGITGVLEGAEDSMVLKFDDNPELLKGKSVNAYFYKDGKYSRILKQIAPTIFTNDAEEFNESSVIFWKGKAENYYEKFVKPKLNNYQGSMGTVSRGTSEEEVPF